MEIVEISNNGTRSNWSFPQLYFRNTKALNSNNNDYFIEDIEKLTIYTDYPNAWFNIFNDSLIYSGFNYSILPLDDTNMVIIEFNDTSGDGYDLMLKEIEISTQVAWGLV